ncbi:MAG: GGDEF domain-containing protein [Nitrospinae bacterium]|nr:GGDEF domain-containing protein [Nitrospinota bacterium]
MNSAKMDLLTGLYSRVGLEEKLNQEQSQSQRTGKSFSMILADIDHIGKINGQFGMKVGDQVIIRTTALLTESAREQDLVARWSSEEFFILLPETSLEDAKKLAGEIRSGIEKERLNFNQHEIPLTLSIGVNTCLPDMKWDKCFSVAEEYLNQAKKLGRNRVITDENN